MDVKDASRMMSTALNLCEFITSTTMGLVSDVAFDQDDASEQLDRAFEEADIVSIMENWDLADYQALKSVREAAEAVLSRLEAVAEVET